jgi:RNA polymerase subunit RPABC4/transcription elongation factor Spt4
MKRKMFITAVLLLHSAAFAQQPARPAKGQPGPEAARARAKTEALRNQAEDHLRWVRTALAPVPNVRVDLDMNNVPVRDALKQVFAQAKQEFVVDADVPEDARITARAKNVQLGTALDLITQSARVRWGREIKDGKTVYRIGKSVRSSVFASPGATGVFSLDLNRLRDSSPLIYRYGVTEQRSTFTCPHCKGQATVLRQNQQPRCPECQRVFQSDWQFCPHDGAKSPAVSSDWKFCPICGKAVDMEKAEQNVPRGHTHFSISEPF